MNAFKQELLQLCENEGISVRFNEPSGNIALYLELGEYECAEQAVLGLKKRIHDDDFDYHKEEG